jgi:hypothetical protein
MNEKITSEIEPHSSKRYGRLISLKNKLESGHDVSVRDLKNALTEAEWFRYEENRASEIENRKIVLPVEIKEYSRRKKLAALAKARLARYLLRPPLSKKPQITKELIWKSELLISSTQEYFYEFIDKNAMLKAWLASSNINNDIDNGELPALISSAYGTIFKRKPERQLSIRDLKEIAINEAIDSIHATEDIIDFPVTNNKKRDFSGFKF